MKKTSSIFTFVFVLLFVSLLSAHNTLAGDTNSVVTQPDCKPKIGWIPLMSKKAKGDAVAADVIEGKTFSNKDELGITGTLPIQIPDPGSTSLPAGYYNNTDLATIDTDLAADNILKGKEIFGVSGTIGIAWGCTPNSGTWDQGKCQTECEAALNGAYDYICLDLCQNINNAFEGFVANLGVIVHKNWFCGRTVN